MLNRPNDKWEGQGEKMFKGHRWHCYKLVWAAGWKIDQITQYLLSITSDRFTKITFCEGLHDGGNAK